MNSWKEAPNLFCNGKFKLEWAGKLEHPFMAFHLSQVQEHSKYYKLIARPISDMSDEELKGCEKMGLSSVYPSTLLRKLLEQVESNEMLGVNERHLLSIGVYPLDQNHNDIIWRYENTKS